MTPITKFYSFLIFLTNINLNDYMTIDRIN